MPYNSDLHHRRSIRLQKHDYCKPGVYFITICSSDRRCLFGEVRDSIMQPNLLGSCVQSCWQRLPHSFARLVLDSFVVMPNHIHGILVLQDSLEENEEGEAFGDRSQQVQELLPNASPLQPTLPRGTMPGSIGAIVQNFKSVSSRKICRIAPTSSRPIWQRNYHEHIIRNDNSLERVRHYIQNNPLTWAEDQLYSNQDF